MKIEKLRKNHKKDIIIGTILTVVIGSTLTYKLTHSKYRVTQSIDLGSGVINYKVPDFKIMAMYKNDGSGDISIDSMPTSGYVINEDKTYCTVDNETQVKGKIKTINGNHIISGLSKSDKCYLFFDKINGAETILANLGTNIKTTTPNFSKKATTDEGVYSTIDEIYDNGTTYYWRGAATTNHVIFANKCWRIVRINGDKTIRLIYNGLVQSGNTCKENGANEEIEESTYNSSSDQSYYVGWTYNNGQRPSNSTNDGTVGTASKIKELVDNWYETNILEKNYDNKVAIGKFCNDRDTETGGTTGWSASGSYFHYAGFKRLYTNKAPTFNCSNPGDIYTLKAGLITADEVMFAGGVFSTNQEFYLCTGKNYWTITPGYMYSFGAENYYVRSDGMLGTYAVAGDYSSYSIRPVINLKSDVTFSSGNGTQNSPYTVS